MDFQHTQTIISIITIFICSSTFFFFWKIESRCIILFTPFQIIMMNEIARVFPAFVSSYYIGSTDYLPIFIFFSGLFSIISGFFFTLSYLKYKPSVLNEFISSKHIISNQTALFFSVLFGTTILIIVGFYKYGGLPSIANAIIGLITGDEYSEIISSVGQNRKFLTKAHIFGGKYTGQGMIKIVSQYGWAFFTGLSLSNYMSTKKISWFFCTAALFGLSFLFIAGDGTRGPFISYICQLFVLYSIYRRIRLQVLLKGAILCVTLLLFMSALSPKLGNKISKEDGSILTYALTKVSKRILIDNGMNDVHAIEFVRKGIISHRLGMLHFNDLLATLPGASGEKPFAYELFKIVKPNASPLQITYLTGTYITKPYVDLGILGVVMTFFIIGCCTGLFQAIIYELNKTTLNSVIIATIAWNLGSTVLTKGIISFAVSLLILSFFCALHMATSTLVKNICIAFSKVQDKKIRLINKVSTNH